jgi:hypothetical protein
VKPFAIFGGIVVVGLVVIFAGLRLTSHSALADPLPAQPTALTHAQFVRAGNAVCDRYYRDDPTIFRNPKTVKALTRDMQIALPFVDSEDAGLRALVPPSSDAATYRRLLAGLGRVEDAVHAMLQAFQTAGGVREGVLIARATARMDSHLNRLANKLGLNICGLTSRQVKARYGHARGTAAPAAHKTNGAAASPTGKSAAPRFVGSYTTAVKVLVVGANARSATPSRTGSIAVRTWTFAQECPGCAITLLRPSDAPSSTLVFRYTLHPIGANRYRGKLNIPDVCYSAGWPPKKVLPDGSVVDHTVITIHPTRTSGGKVVAYAGMLTVTAKPSGWGRREGCIAHGYTQESVKSPQ